MYSPTPFNTISHFYYTLLKYPLIKFFHNFIFFLFTKQGKSIAISLHFAIKVILTYLNNGILKIVAKVLRTNPGSSKHFFEIFPNFIWESSLNIYYLDKLELLRKRNSLTLTFANKD